MKKIEKYIGQANAKAIVNEIVSDFKRREAEGRKLPFLRPLFLEGPAGMGKTHFADAIADCMGWQFVSMPVAGGIRELNRVAAKIASIDQSTGHFYAVPSVIFVDEVAATPKAALNIIKAMTEGEPGMFVREGTEYVRDLTQHLWVFASNEKVDKAIVSRCEVLAITPYNKGERKAIIQLNSDVPITPDALEFLADRTKSTARECKALGIKMARQGHARIDLPTAKEVCRVAKIWPGGFSDKEVQMLSALHRGRRFVGASVIAMLLGKQGAGKNAEAEEVANYMAHSNLLRVSDGGTRYAISEGGIKYLRAVAELQRKAA